MPFSQAFKMPEKRGSGFRPDFEKIGSGIFPVTVWAAPLHEVLREK
jgi:hypothetical protein